jgi:putative DNA primase/helicase
LRYAPSDFSPYIPKQNNTQNTPTINTTSDNNSEFKAKVGTSEKIINSCSFIRYCRDNSANLPEPQWYAMLGNLALCSDGREICHAFSKNYPGYNSAETDKKIDHSLAEKKPHSCEYIRNSLGFDCGNCTAGCKSPVALAIRLMTTDEILNILNSLEKKDSTLQNIQITRQFIQDYLFNIDGITAETFLNHDIKDKFCFKQSDLTPLIKLHRELYKKYSDSKEIKATRAKSNELPAWYELTDKGTLKFLPGALAGYLKENVAAFYSADQYYLFTNGVYNAVQDLEAKNVVRGHLIEKHATLNNVNDAEGQWRMSILKPVTDLNANPYIVNVQNGLLNVITGELKPHNTDYFSTVQLAVNYLSNAKCPNFMKYLEHSYYPEDIPLIQEMFGYFLVPITKAQKAFVIVGAAGAGKSLTLLTVNKILLGQKNVSNVMWQSLNERFKTAELFGKYGNIFADLPSKAIDDNGMFKALVGEDFITAERKGKDPFTFQSYARFLFSCNAIPRNYGDKSEGFYRRLIIIPFAEKQLTKERKDVELFDKLQAEADGIFMFALEGLKRLIENKFRFSETKNTNAELHKYRVDSNSVLSFVEEFCVIVSDGETERNMLFEKYHDYCKDGNLVPVSQKTFNKDIESAYPNLVRAKDKVGRRKTWRGIRYGKED